ncbi:MAG: PqqD family protein [Candidatus Cloacimonetes bacterium]|jgi:hypothetical protein|nr:PqqD family protein [Clostridia bacterium]MDD2683301.1 PqqD family protein [Candidatus Cloacimonadota bacterium]MDD3092669.1 PqqD family protein [Clostridia bacterium]MDD3971470.1 PqqD family protein [Clostridia bacterium]
MKLKSSINFSKIENEGVLFNTSNGAIYSLNEIATRIVEYLPICNSIDEIAEKLQEEYDAELEEIISDINELISDMKEQNFLDE